MSDQPRPSAQALASEITAAERLWWNSVVKARRTRQGEHSRSRAVTAQHQWALRQRPSFNHGCWMPHTRWRAMTIVAITWRGVSRSLQTSTQMQGSTFKCSPRATADAEISKIKAVCRPLRSRIDLIHRCWSLTTVARHTVSSHQSRKLQSLQPTESSHILQDAATGSFSLQKASAAHFSPVSTLSISGTPNARQHRSCTVQ